uniref:Uncharacterized protein n=1 Tax=Ditylenchus dipsaci TaxID=166011 RepID=A0A915DID0_9BILA
MPLVEEVVGENKEKRNSQPTRTVHAAICIEKIPMPASIESLLQIKGDEEKYRLTFIHSTRSRHGQSGCRPDGGTTKYDLVDPEADDPSLHESFAVISYSGSDGTGNRRTLNKEIFCRLWQIALLQSNVELVSFHNRKVESKEEVELFQLEAKVARHYYALKRAAVGKHGIGLFSGFAPIRPEKAGQTPSMNTPARVADWWQMQTPNTGGNLKISRGRVSSTSRRCGKQIRSGRTAQQIMEYIKMNGHKSGGVSADEIKRACKVNDKFQDDINFLLGEELFTTPWMMTILQLFSRVG